MKAAFVGKGGSGKTTLASLFVRHLVAQNLPVVAVDADINQHLGTALGLGEAGAERVPAMAEHMETIKTYLRGDNPRITSNDVMIKTTPAGHGSRVLRVRGDDPIHALGAEVDGALLLRTGAFTPDDLGVACYHSKTGAVELYLNHLLDGPGEYVVADMTAGADSFASGLFTRFDVLFLVVEPTRKAVSVYRQFQEYAPAYGVQLCAIGNKVQDQDDVAYLQTHVGDNLLGWMGQSPAVRAFEQGRTDIPLEPASRKLLKRVQGRLDAQPKDWVNFQYLAELFHARNAQQWANARVGADLTRQIDPGFRLDLAEQAA